MEALGLNVTDLDKQVREPISCFFTKEDIFCVHNGSQWSSEFGYLKCLHY